jgi:RHS repeat-associated protein
VQPDDHDPLSFSVTIIDNEREASFGASVAAATEGSDVVLTITADEELEFEYWVEDVSASDGSDYTGASGTVWADPYNDGVVAFPTIPNLLDEAIRSFKVHVRIAGAEESEVVLEADILDDDEPGIVQTVEYAYDVYNRLVSRSLDADGEGEQAATDSYYSWESGQIILEFDGTDLSHRYLYGPAVDQLLADENALGDVLYPLADHLNTARDLAMYDFVQDETTIVNHRVFDSFGNLISESDNSFLFGFTGRLFDEASGLQNNWNRWYDPRIGQWLSEDPIGFDGDRSNLYRYVGNSPTSRSDPTGLIDPDIQSGDYKRPPGWPNPDPKAPRAPIEFEGTLESLPGALSQMADSVEAKEEAKRIAEAIKNTFKNNWRWRVPRPYDERIKGYYW